LPIAAGAIAPLASPGSPASPLPSLARWPSSGEPATIRGEVLGQVVDLDAIELARDREQRTAQPRRLQHADDEMAAAHLPLAEHQRAVHPGALDGVLDPLREIGDRARATRQPVERRGEVAGEHRGVEAVVANDPVQVRVLVVEDLRDPVLQLDERIAAQLAEDGRAFDRLVGERVELAEQGAARDLRHGGLRDGGEAGTRSRAAGAGRRGRARLRRGRATR
jgi:hypothetical protein